MKNNNITQSIARRELSRVEKNGKETVIYDIIHFDFDKEIREDIDFIFDDYEYAQNHGVNYWEEDLYLITVNDLIEELKDKLLDNDYDGEREKKMIKYFEKYQNFIIWVL